MTSRRQETTVTGTSRRRQLSRRQQERRKQLIAVAAIGVFILVIGGVIAYGYITTFVLPSRQLVAQVNEVKYTTGDLIRILRMMQAGAEFSGQSLNLASLPFQVINGLVDNELISQAAPRFGILISLEEVDEEIRSRILPPVSQGQVTDPDQLDREFAERYREYLNTIQFSEAEHRKLIKQDLYRSRLREILGQSVPAVAEQIHIHVIPLDTNENYEILKRKFEDGTPFKELASEFSIDPAFAADGSDLGWVPRGALSSQEEFLFDLEVGKLSDPIPQPQGEALVYLVSEKADAREIDDDDRDTLKNGALQDWLLEERPNNEVKTNFDSDTYYWVIEQLEISSRGR